MLWSMNANRKLSSDAIVDSASCGIHGALL